MNKFTRRSPIIVGEGTGFEYIAMEDYEGGEYYLADDVDDYIKDLEAIIYTLKEKVAKYE